MSEINPQKENGHRQIANDVMEALIKAKLSGAEYQLTLFIIHKTWGWRKQFDKISYSQIIKATNLTRPGAINTLKKLEKKHILVVERKVVNGSLPINNYLFNKHYDTWVKQTGKQTFTTLELNEMELVNKQNGTGKQTKRKVVNGSLHTKESITKDTSTKEIYISIFETWNEQKITIHKRLTDEMKGAINGCLKNKAENKDEIIQSIKNYKRVWISDKHWLKYSWTLIEFLRRGFEKCRDWETANITYKNKETKKPQGRGEARRVSAGFENGRTQI